MTIDITLANFFAVMSILTGFTCALLASFLMLAPTPRPLPNRLLAVFLVLTAVELSGWLWVDTANQNHWTNALRLALGKLQMPVFFGFFLTSCYADARLRWRDSVHLIPFLLALVLALPGDQILLRQTAPGEANLVATEQTALTIGAHLLYYGYMAAVVWVLVQFWRLYRAQHAAGRSETLLWLTQLAAASLAAHTLILIRDGLRLSPAYELVLALQLAGAVFALGIVSWIALKSLLQPQLFRTVDRRLMSLNPARSHERRADIEHVRAHMQTHTPFLDPDLTLAQLADQLALTPRELSELLNQALGVHFFDFVNQYRVQYAQTLLSAPNPETITEILHAAGFNSKSSFNTAFKKHTGMTPSAFRDSCADAPP